MKIVVTASYTPELADSTSDAFRELAAKIEDAINLSLAQHGVAGRAQVISFTREELEDVREIRNEAAGVLANVEIIFQETKADLNDQQNWIAEATQTAIDNSPDMSGSLEVTKQVEKLGKNQQNTIFIKYISHSNPQ